MNKIELKHNNNGVALTINGSYLGIFENEKEAFYYLLLNDYIENLYIERSVA